MHSDPRSSHLRHVATSSELHEQATFRRRHSVQDRVPLRGFRAVGSWSRPIMLEMNGHVSEFLI